MISYHIKLQIRWECVGILVSFVVHFQKRKRAMALCLMWWMAVQCTKRKTRTVWHELHAHLYSNGRCCAAFLILQIAPTPWTNILHWLYAKRNLISMARSKVQSDPNIYLVRCIRSYCRAYVHNIKLNLPLSIRSSSSRICRLQYSTIVRIGLIHLPLSHVSQYLLYTLTHT